jgi:uncharacterized phage protein (TIGR01671 family)
MELELMDTRLIKFRLWNGTKMIVPTRIHNNKLNDEEKLMQFSGLHDVHGKEIYEGDIVLPAKFKDIPNTVIFTMNGFYRVKIQKGRTYRNILGTCALIVIGNIFENEIEVTPEGPFAFVVKPNKTKKPLNQ